MTPSCWKQQWAGLDVGHVSLLHAVGDSLFIVCKHGYSMYIRTLQLLLLGLPCPATTGTITSNQHLSTTSPFYQTFPTDLYHIPSVHPLVQTTAAMSSQATTRTKSVSSGLPEIHPEDRNLAEKGLKARDAKLLEEDLKALQQSAQAAETNAEKKKNINAVHAHLKAHGFPEKGKIYFANDGVVKAVLEDDVTTETAKVDYTKRAHIFTFVRGKVFPR
jgi:hypothetical protein